jgi:hypothetical protein
MNSGSQPGQVRISATVMRLKAGRPLMPCLEKLAQYGG